MNSNLQYPSLRFLQERIGGLFRNAGLSPAFPGNGCDLIWPSEEVIDVVLFGDALRVLLDCDDWPRFRRFRLWVLNEEHRQILTKVFPLALKSISVIPRAALVKKPARTRNFPSLESPINFIFCGRPVEGKNLRLVSRVVQDFQGRGIDARLHVFGFGHPEEYFRFIPEKGWRKKPFIHGDKGKNWIGAIPSNSVFLHLGWELTDDFSVSCAEAEEHGIPLIVPARGPYVEVSAGKIIKVPREIIRSGAHEAVTEYLSRHWKERGTSSGQRTKELTLPEALEHHELRRIFVRRNKFHGLIHRAFRDGPSSPSGLRLEKLLEER